ncbi:hypothetical protein GGR54DRAFT_634662 [Hypoxylon sp. NC1633]|nr:hypothetical protein GGR54DRAFT_634662 [Hypoxylon sp. NC1633]
MPGNPSEWVCSTLGQVTKQYTIYLVLTHQQENLPNQYDWIIAFSLEDGRTFTCIYVTPANSAPGPYTVNTKPEGTWSPWTSPNTLCLFELDSYRSREDISAKFGQILQQAHYIAERKLVSGARRTKKFSSKTWAIDVLSKCVETVPEARKRSEGFESCVRRAANLTLERDMLTRGRGLPGLFTLYRVRDGNETSFSSVETVRPSDVQWK